MRRALALLDAPWKTSALSALATVALFQWLLPSLATSHSLLWPAALVLQRLGLPVAGLFGLLAIVLWFQQRNAPATPAEAATSEPADAHPPSVAQERTGKPAPIARPLRAPPNAIDAPRAPALARPAHWSLELLRDIEWKRFEELCAAYYREMRWRTETIHYGPDGGIDIRLYGKDATHPTAIVQCKATDRARIESVRALYGVMKSENIEQGMFLCRGGFPEQASDFATGKALELVDGKALLKKIRALPAAGQQRLLDVATEGEFLTPTCVACGSKMAPGDLLHYDRIARPKRRWRCPKCQHQLTVKLPSLDWQN